MKKRFRSARCWPLLPALLIGAAAPVSSSTFLRLGLEDLTANSTTVIVGEVLNAHSYWSADSSFILTDVEVVPLQVLKGRAEGSVLKVTLLGGSVGELTSLIVGGAELLPGRSYVLFLREGELLGNSGAQTVPEHSQGVFEIMRAETGLRAVSQAIEHGVLPDARGRAEPPGGRSGLPLNEMLERIQVIVDQTNGMSQR